MPRKATDFVAGLVTLATNGDARLQAPLRGDAVFATQVEGGVAGQLAGVGQVVVTLPLGVQAGAKEAVDPRLEARKREAEAAEAAKKKAEEARIARQRAENCERARSAKATLDSGVRIATTNAKGEREIMDDKARASETQRLNEIIRTDCGPAPQAQAQ